MKGYGTILWVVVLMMTCLGCEKSAAKESLPPPTGPGAAPLPELPVAKLSGTEGAVASSDQLMVTGTAQPISEAKIGPKGSGVIAAMQVEEGDRVKKGQVLFRLNMADQNLALSQAEAALSSALVGENTAKTEYQRISALRERGSISPATYDQVKAMYDGAQSAVALARTAVNRVKQAVVDTTVRAPIAGVVSRRMASVGDTVTMMPPTVVLIIQDISELEIRGRVPETMLAKLKPGSQVRVRFPSIDVERTVAITRINPSVDTMTRTIEVVARMQNQDNSLKAGMLVELMFGESAASGEVSPAVSSDQPASK